MLDGLMYFISTNIGPEADFSYFNQIALFRKKVFSIDHQKWRQLVTEV